MEELNLLNQRADIIISLLLRIAAKDSSDLNNLQDQVSFLHSFGLKSKEISKILNKTDGHIRKELTIARKPKRVKK